jgi:hypothetical protein
MPHSEHFGGARFGRSNISALDTSAVLGTPRGSFICSFLNVIKSLAS